MRFRRLGFEETTARNEHHLLGDITQRLVVGPHEITIPALGDAARL